MNKKVYRLMNEEWLSIRKQKLLILGFAVYICYINAFCKGISMLGEETSDFIILIHNFFTGWPSRWDDYECIQKCKKVPNLHFIKYCLPRCLTLENAASRLIQQWDAVEE